MVRLLRRSIAGGGIALFALLLLLPVSAQASTSKIDSTTSAHLARALASAPRGVTHWSITVSQMTATHFTGSAGRFGAGFLTNTVYGSCGSSWMALGNLGRGHAWVSLGWDINKPAYWRRGRQPSSAGRPPTTTRAPGPSRPGTRKAGTPATTRISASDRRSAMPTCRRGITAQAAASAMARRPPSTSRTEVVCTRIGQSRRRRAAVPPSLPT